MNVAKVTTFVVCMICGTRWERYGPAWGASPRECKNPECEAGWLNLPCFARAEDADRAAAQVPA